MGMLQRHGDSDDEWRDRATPSNLLWNPKSLWVLGPVTGAFILYQAVNFGWLPSPMMAAMEKNTAALSKVGELTASAQKALADAQNSIAKTAEAREARLEAIQQRMELLNKGLRRICRQNAKIMKSPDLNEQCDEL